MTARRQLYCAYCGYAAIVIFLIGWVALAQFVPPPHPSDSANEVYDMFDENRTGIRLGMVLSIFASALFMPWIAAIAVQVKRIEGRYSPVAYIQIIAAACYVLEFVFPLAFWATAAFREDSSPEIVRTLNDLAWIPFIALVSPAVIQVVALGLVILQDSRERPIFPRWFAYFSFWAGTLITPGVLIIFFKDGPFSWAGLVSFWIAFSVFTTWVITMTVMLVRAIKRQATDPPDEDDLAARVESLEKAFRAAGLQLPAR